MNMAFTQTFKEVVIKALELAMAVVEALDSKQADRIRIFDLTSLSTITDYTVVASGTSGPHLKALISEVQRSLKEEGARSYRSSGTPDSGWVVLDFVDVVVHVFSEEARDYYAIEKLWTTAREIPHPQS